MYTAERPAFFMPDALDRPSGMFDRKIAITAVRLTPAPPSRLTPITTDSGTPSSNAPSAIAVPLSASDGCCSPDRLRCFAPRRDSQILANVYTVAPATKPDAVGHSPPWLKPSSISSNDRAEIKTPLPNDMTKAMTRDGTAAK